MRPKGWFGESQRHSLAARGIKTRAINKKFKQELPQLYSKTYEKWQKKNQKKIDEVAQDQALLYQTLGVRYKEDIRKQPWFKKALAAIAIKVVPSSAYNTLPQERALEAHGEMSYAMTTLTPDSRREQIIIRDSGDKALNKKLLKHEMEEYRIYRKLLESGMSPAEAQPLSHELTFTKVTDREVDRAYGNIGNPC